MNIEQLQFHPHPARLSGTQALCFFHNGYGASIVTGSIFYTDTEHLYELAVLRGNAQSFTLDYSTPITDDVLGHLDANGVNEILAKIEMLEQPKNLKQ